MGAESALGGALGGASGTAGLINAVGNLLPTTTTSSGHTDSSSTANSDTKGGEVSLNSGSTTGSQTSILNSINEVLNTGLTTGANSETGSNKSSSVTSGLTNENFSGQTNSTTTQTLLNNDGVMRIVNMMLQGTGGIPGLQETVSPERSSNLYNSSTNSLVTSNLVSTIAGEVARLSAPTVQSQNLGATNTQTSSNTSTLMDAITNALSNVIQNTNTSEASKGTNTGSTTSQEDVLNLVMSIAQQLTDQSSQSTSDNSAKTKTKKFPTYICTWLESLLSCSEDRQDFEALSKFKLDYLIPYQPRLLLVYDVIGPMIVGKLEQLDKVDQYQEAVRVRNQFITPAAEKFDTGDNLGALSIYTEMVLKLHDKYIRGV